VNREDIGFLYDYHYWATRRVLERAIHVTPEQYIAPSPAPHGSLRDTLVHALAAEVAWRQRMQESISPRSLAVFDELGTADEIRAVWRDHEERFCAYLAGLTDADLRGTFRFRRTDGEELEFGRGRALAHVVNHATQHRAEAAILLTEYGQSPGDLDMSIYICGLLRGEG
jgi:uncharacterized damage-inducible protein DinB